MSLSFRNRILLTIFISCLVCTSAAVFFASRRVHDLGEEDLVGKSRAILSRLEVVRAYVADQGTLDNVIAEAVKSHPDGNLPKETKLNVLKSVPIFASMQVGAKEADKENYAFRIFSEDARNKDNNPTPEEKEHLKRFATDRNLHEIIEKSADGSFIKVMRPVYLSEAQGCLNCHGHPSQSPWGNGKDILGYPMENWKDGDLHGAFAIISSLEPVNAAATNATINILGWGAGFTLLALALGFLIVRGPISTITNIAGSLGESGEQVNSASQEIANASQALSSRANEAASSLEETVASMEELSSMVKQNADNAQEANSLSATSRQVAEKGETEIKALIHSMNEIAESSKKIESIINVIDDIAFQTNLLALNAAVEAARAGEQGKGFAVVAEAVRNLAQRSASAAKDISSLISESVEKSQRGTTIADNSGRILSEIVTQAKKVSDLVAEIAAASQEQARGIEQIGQAMNQLDQATQENAATSEESAAASEELSAQSHAMDKIVAELNSVISGREMSHQTTAPRRKTASAGKKLQMAKATKSHANGNGKTFSLDDDDHDAVSGF